jgi:hypothetical protein
LYKRLVVALFAVLVVAVVAAGCGGGGSSSSSTADTDTTSSTEAESGGSTEASEGEAEAGGTAPTKAAFIKEADGICGKADAAMSEEITEFAEEKNIPITKEEPSEDQQTEIFESVVLPNIAKQAEDIAALTPPEGEEETVEDITDTLSKEVEEAEEDPSNLSEDTLKGATEKAHAYGFKTCGG